jgi:regulator of nucleoside diphosphate kinase
MELNFSAGRVSVLSPLGTALIGRRAGDRLQYLVRGLPRNVRIASILYQPEADQRRTARPRARHLVG